MILPGANWANDLNRKATEETEETEKAPESLCFLCLLLFKFSGCGWPPCAGVSKKPFRTPPTRRG